MIYRVLFNGVDIYGSTPEMTLLNPSLETELNNSGSFEFTMPPGHSFYDVPNVLTSYVEVYEDNDLIWFGRPISIERNWNNEKVVSCEGALSYFNDTVQRPQEYDSILVRQFFRNVIAENNAQLTNYPDKQFTVGNITIQDKYVYRELSYDTTFDVLQQMCLNAEGGYLFVRRENGVNYIDWLAEVPYVATQAVQFAVNLLDISQTLNGDEVCSQLLPLGASLSRAAKVKDNTAYLSIYESKDTSSEVVGRVESGKEVTFEWETPYDADWMKISQPYAGYAQSQFLQIQSGDVPLTISTVNSGSDILVNADAVEAYGPITKVKQFSQVRNPNELKEKGLQYLNDEQYDKLSIEVDAAELHYIDSSYDAFKVGQLVHVTSTPHLLDKELPMTKISVSLDSGVKKIQIGTPPHKTLTEIYKDGG